MDGGTAQLVHSGKSNYGSGFQIDLYVYTKVVYQDIENNYTRFAQGMYVQTPNKNSTIAWTDLGGSYIGVKDIVTHNFTCSVSYKGGKIWLVKDKEFNIQHNEDGTKWIDVIWKWDVNSTWGEFVRPKGIIGMYLPIIPRASDVSCTDFNIGSTAMINIANNSSAFTYTLEWSFGKSKKTIIEKTKETCISWNTSETMCKEIPNSASGKGIITCYSYVGDTLVGTSFCSFNAFVINSDPVLETSIVDANDTTKELTGDENTLIKYFSNAKITINARALNYATIKSYSIKCDDGKSSTNSETIMNKVESGHFTIVVTDSRGFKTSKVIEKTMIDYIKLALTDVKVKRESSTSSNVYLTYKGQYFSESFGNLLNTLSIRYRTRLKNGVWGEYTILEPTINNKTISQSNILIGNDFSYHNSYDFEIVASDKLIGESETKVSKEIKIGEGLFEIRKNLFGIHGAFTSDTKLLNEVNLDSCISRTFFATCIKCSNAPNNIIFGFLLNISRNGVEERELFNKQFFFDGETNDIYIRTMNNKTWLNWKKI